MTEVFGKVYAPAYDLIYREKDYEGETELLGQLFRRYSEQPVCSVLDLGCGTGNHALRLAARGYQVVGVDRSIEMLSLAERKARNLKGSLRFQRADIRNVDLGKTFDAVIMMFAVLSYQLEDADVRSVLQTVRRHLRKNGLLLFEVWYGPAVVTQCPEDRIRTIEQNGTTWMRTSSGRLETQRNLCHVEFQLRRMQDDQILDETKECHSVRYFFPAEIEQFLSDSGFRLFRLGASPAFDRDPDRTTWNVMAVAATL